jgi:hypothetical protein
MREPGRRTGLALLVLALAVITAGIWVVMERWQAGVLESVESSPAEARMAPDDLLEQSDDRGIPAVGAYTDLTERPLFTSTRRPPVVEEESVAVVTESEPEQPLPELTDLRLISVVITPVQQQAWFREGRTDALLRLAAGDTFREWTLHRVEPSYVTFRARGSEYRVDLRPVGAVVNSGPARGRVAPQSRRW